MAAALTTNTTPQAGEGLRTDLAVGARRVRSALPDADIDAAVEAGMLAAATAAAEQLSHGQDRVPGGAAPAATIQVAAVAAAVQRQGLPAEATTPADLAEFGALLPVLAASPGAGASVLAATLADTLALAGQRVLLVDPADPPRSGLAAAARIQGPWLVRPHPLLGIRFSWRHQALLAQVETGMPVVAPGMVPPPPWWRPPGADGVQATVIDLGHDPWRVAAHPLAGPGAWLRRGTPPPRPLLVVRPSRPSLLHAEQVLARLQPWVACGMAVPPAQLVVMGATRWPPGVAGAAGRRTTPLLDDAVFVPHDRDLAAGGITAELTPARARRAITPLLRRWNLAPDPAPRGRPITGRRS